MPAVIGAGAAVAVDAVLFGAAGGCTGSGCGAVTPLIFYPSIIDLSHHDRAGIHPTAFWLTLFLGGGCNIDDKERVLFGIQAPFCSRPDRSNDMVDRSPPCLGNCR